MPSVSIGVSVTGGGFPADAAAVATITGLTDGFAVTGVELTGSYPGASTAQWQSKTGAGVWTNIAGATSATFTPLIGTNVADEDLIRVVPDGNESLASASYTVARAAGADPSIAAQSWLAGETVDLDITPVGANISPFTYAATGLAAGLSTNDNTDRLEGALAAGADSGSIMITATDKYGRDIAYSAFAYTTAVPVITIDGLDGGIARIGSEGSITTSADQGTISARRWGLVSGGNVLGTGVNPSDMTAGDEGTLYAGSQINGIWYEETAPIAHDAAVNTIPPAVTGTTGLGDTLTTDNGTWTGATGGSYSYQWQRDGVDIEGETATTYTITVEDSGAQVHCAVTYTNSGGAVVANSNDVTIQTFTFPSITGVPTISGTETVGQVLTATAATTSGNPTPSRTWQWERSGTPIGGATNSTYTLVEADEGETITVVQTESNAVGSDSAESVATGVITAPDTTAPIVNLFEFEQAAAGDPILITLVMQDTGETNPLDAAIVFVPQGDPKPSIAQIKAGLNNAGTDALFYITKTFSGDVTGEAGTLVREPTPPFSGAVDGYCVVSDDAPNDSARAEFLNVTIETTAAVGWSITDNGDGTFDIASAPAAGAALTITDNGDGTFDVAA